MNIFNFYSISFVLWTTNRTSWQICGIQARIALCFNVKFHFSNQLKKKIVNKKEQKRTVNIPIFSQWSWNWSLQQWNPNDSIDLRWVIFFSIAWKNHLICKVCANFAVHLNDCRVGVNLCNWFSLLSSIFFFSKMEMRK